MLPVLFLLPCTPPLVAVGPPPIFVDAEGVAIGGYDVVSYFSGRAPWKGLTRWKVEHQGAQFLFASSRNRELFLADPRKFVPQFGGYCALALSAGKLRKCDPRRFSIRDGRLFLFSTRQARDRWEREDTDLLSLAVAKWREIVLGKPSHPSNR